MAAATTERPTPTRPKKPPATCYVRTDARGVSIELPKQSGVTLCRARDILSDLAVCAPTISGQAKGIALALGRLIADIASGPKPMPLSDGETSEETNE